MSPNIESYPFEQRPGMKIGQGFDSLVKELGKDWVIKEWNPLRPDGTNKERSYEKTQSHKNIKELQETQKILSQDYIYGDRLLPTYWILGSDNEGREKYFAIQKRFHGDTLENIIKSGDKSISYDERLKQLFSENIGLREQMLNLIWGSKRALVEFGVYDDFNPDNIAVIIENDVKQDLKIFDIQNMIRTQRLLYNDPNCPVESKRNILEKTDKRRDRLIKYEKLLEVTEKEKKILDQKYGVENGKYEEVVSSLLQMYEQLN